MMQGLLCSTLQVIIQKLNPNSLEHMEMDEAVRASVTQCSQAMVASSDALMQAFLAVFRCRSATVHEEALLAVGALIDACGASFIKYLQHFYPFVEMGLRNFEQYQVCIVTVSVVGDLCRALQQQLLPYCDGIVTLLLQDLQSNELHKSVKPPILSAFGDLALALGPEFAKYLPVAVNMLQSAAQHCLLIQPAEEDDEAVEYLNQLRSGILEAYAGVLQGVKDESDPSRLAVLTPYADHVLVFIEKIHTADNADETVTRNAVAVLGDMADAMPATVGPLFRQRTFYQDMLKECNEQQDDDELKQMVQFAHSTISKAIAGAH